jgi:hypothetical protein
MDAAQALYQRSGFRPLCAPMGGTGHFSCDRFFHSRTLTGNTESSWPVTIRASTPTSPKSAPFAQPILEHLRDCDACHLPRGGRRRQVEHAVLQLQKIADVHDGRIQAALRIRLLAVQAGRGGAAKNGHGPVRQAHCPWPIYRRKSSSPSIHQESHGVERGRRETEKAKSRTETTAAITGRLATPNSS